MSTHNRKGRVYKERRRERRTKDPGEGFIWMYVPRWNRVRDERPLGSDSFTLYGTFCLKILLYEERPLFVDFLSLSLSGSLTEEVNTLDHSDF